MIGSLQSLRFIFAIMIFLHHCSVDGVSLFYTGGDCGVSFFIILSGFVMSLGYSTKIRTESFDNTLFLKKRLIRIYPLHLLCLLIFLAFNILSLSVIGYIKLIPNLFLLQSWIPMSSYYFSGNAVSWCLSCFLFFYIAFPFIIKAFKNYNRNTLLVIGGMVIVAYCIVLIVLPDRATRALLYISPLFRLLDFMIGMVLYNLYWWIETKGIGMKMRSLSFFKKSVLEIIVIIALSACIIIAPHISVRYLYASYWWILIPALILLFAIFNISGGGISWILNRSILLRLGEFSFSFYIIHQLGLTLLATCASKLNIDLPWQIATPIYFSIIMVACYLISHYYEKPITRFLKLRL